MLSQPANAAMLSIPKNRRFGYFETESSRDGERNQRELKKQVRWPIS